MPERRRVKRIKSEEVQGADSWVKVQQLTVAEAREVQQSIRDMIGASPKEIAQRDDEILATHVLDWNWVDDEGNPLPKPHGNREVMGSLTGQETAFLVQAIRGTSEDELGN